MDLADQYPVFYLLGPWRVLVAQSRFGTGGAKLFGGCSPGFHGKGLPGAILRGWCWSVWSQFFWDVDHDFSGTEAFIKFEDSICVSWKQWLCKFWISIYHFKCFLWNAVFYIFTCFLRSISSHIFLNWCLLIFKGTCEALHSELQLHKWCRSLPTDETDSLVFYCIVYLLWPLWELWNPLTFFGVFFSQKKWTQLALKAILVRFTWNSRLFRYRAVAHSWLRGQEIHQVPPPTLAQTGWKPDLWRLPLCVWRSSGRPRLSPQNFQFQANLYKFDSVIFCFVLWCGTGSANGRHMSQTNPKPTQMPRIMAQ